MKENVILIFFLLIFSYISTPLIDKTLKNGLNNDNNIVNIAIADNFYDHVLVMLAGNAAAFSLLWIVRFAVLEHLLWGDRAESQLTESST